MKDYLENLNEAPEEVQAVFAKYNDIAELSFPQIARMRLNLAKLGWVFDYDSPSDPSNLRPMEGNLVRQVNDIRLEYTPEESLVNSFTLVLGKNPSKITRLDEIDVLNLMGLDNENFVSYAIGKIFGAYNTGWEIADYEDLSTLLIIEVDEYIYTIREWADEPTLNTDELLSADSKISRWEDSRWVEKTIDLRDYSVEQIYRAVIPFGLNHTKDQMQIAMCVFRCYE